MRKGLAEDLEGLKHCLEPIFTSPDEIGHLIDVLSRWQTSDVLSWAQYGYGSNMEPLGIGERGSGKSGGQKSSPNTQYHVPGYEIGYDAEILSRGWTSAAPLRSRYIGKSEIHYSIW